MSGANNDQAAPIIVSANNTQISAPKLKATAKEFVPSAAAKEFVPASKQHLKYDANPFMPNMVGPGVSGGYPMQMPMNPTSMPFLMPGGMINPGMMAFPPHGPGMPFPMGGYMGPGGHYYPPYVMSGGDPARMQYVNGPYPPMQGSGPPMQGGGDMRQHPQHADRQGVYNNSRQKSHKFQQQAPQSAAPAATQAASADEEASPQPSDSAAAMSGSFTPAVPSVPDKVVTINDESITEPTAAVAEIIPVSVVKDSKPVAATSSDGVKTHSGTNQPTQSVDTKSDKEALQDWEVVDVTSSMINAKYGACATELEVPVPKRQSDLAGGLGIQHPSTSDFSTPGSSFPSSPIISAVQGVADASATGAGVRRQVSNRGFSGDRDSDIGEKHHRVYPAPAAGMGTKGDWGRHPSSTGLTGSGEREREKEDWTRGSREESAGAMSGAGTQPGGWKRGELMPLTAEDLFARNDGVVRYRKMDIIMMFKRVRTAPDAITAAYPEQSKLMRDPILPKGSRITFEDTESPEDATFFAKDRGNVFKFDPSRLADGSDPQVIERKANLILNKLSVTKFDKLSDEFMNVGIDNVDMMKTAVNMIVNKAQMEEHFCFMYADLCCKIIDVWSGKEIGPDMTLGKAFREALLERCRDEFEIDRIAELSKIAALEIPADEKLEKEVIIKKKYTGHMRFIGEVYMKDIVHHSVMHDCITSLLESVEEENLICLCKLMTTMGAKLDAYFIKKKKSAMNVSFEKIIKLSKTHSSSRIRSLLLNVVEMRANNWRARREEEKATKIGGSDSSKTDSGCGGQRPQDARSQAPSPAPSDGWTEIPTKGKKGGGTVGSVFQGSASIHRSQSQSSMGSNPSPRGGSVGGGFSALSSTSKGGKKTTTGKAGSISTNTGRPGTSGGGSSSTHSAENSGPKNDSAEDNRMSQPERSPANVEENSSQSDRNEATVDIAEHADGRVGADGAPIEKEKLKKARFCVEEYLNTGIADDVVQELVAHFHPNSMGDVIKFLLNFIIDRKQNEQKKFCQFLSALHHGGYLVVSAWERGLLLFLNDIDDLIADVPKAVTYTGYIVAYSICLGLIPNLSFLASIPEENSFSLSLNVPALIGETLFSIAEIVRSEVLPARLCPDDATGVGEAEACFRASGIDLLSQIQLVFRESKVEAVAEFIKRYNLPFLA